MNDRTAHPTPTVPALRPPLPPSPLASRLAYWGYDAVGGLAALLALPAWPWLRKRGFDDGIEERLGRLPAAAGALAAPPIWLHCASVGEALSATPLVTRLRERCPQRPLVVSTTTTTGRAVARDELARRRRDPVAGGCAARRRPRLPPRPPARAAGGRDGDLAGVVSRRRARRRADRHRQRPRVGPHRGARPLGRAAAAGDVGTGGGVRHADRRRRGAHRRARRAGRSACTSPAR